LKEGISQALKLRVGEKGKKRLRGGSTWPREIERKKADG